MTMTKKAERAAQVAANRRAAYFKRVRTLIGHVLASSAFERVTPAQLDAAIAAGKTADMFAAEVASREPVGKAVHPLKAQAVLAARKYAEEQIAEIKADLEKHGWDLNKAAPYPNSITTGRKQYIEMIGKYQLYSSVTQWAGNGIRRGGRGEPNPVEMSPEGCQRHTTRLEEIAAFNYDAFICKLVMKVGACKSANLHGDHVWQSSTLTVVLKDGTKQRWFTQQITNRSVLGKYFPQWPTRLMKEKGK